MKKLFLTFLFLVFSSPAFADTTAFGMTLGKTTEAEVKKMYALKLTGTNKHSRGNMYQVLNTGIMEDLKSLTVVFNKKGQLWAIQAVFPRSRQAELFDSLRKKYKLVYNATRFTDAELRHIGPSRAGFDGDDTEIDMFTPNKTGAETTLLYSHKLFVAMQADVEKEEKMQNKKQMDATL